jgi:hypothetical protein
MSRRHPAFLSLALLLVLPDATPFLSAQPSNEKPVWNYDGGLVLMTDGSIPQGPCFRLSGRATAPGYFDNLKRIDSDLGTVLHRGHDIVTEFPEKLHLSFVMYDLPCENQLQHAGTRLYLTRAMVGTLRLSFYWKRGLKMRPVTGVVQGYSEIRRVLPYAVESASELPEKYEWWFEFDLPSAGVPVTDSLVVIMRGPDNHIAARVAARM